MTIKRSKLVSLNMKSIHSAPNTRITKAVLVYLTKEDYQNSFVKEHKHDDNDVKCIRPISVNFTLNKCLCSLRLNLINCQSPYGQKWNFIGL